MFIKTRRKRWNIVLICARATPAGSWKLSRGLPALISLPAGMYLYAKMPGRKICCSALGVNGFLNRPRTYVHSHSLALPLREDRKGCVCHGRFLNDRRQEDTLLRTSGGAEVALVRDCSVQACLSAVGWELRVQVK